MLCSPVDPALEVLYGHFIAVNDLALKISVDFVEVESVGTRDEALCFKNICTKLIDGTCRARIVTC